MPGKAAISLTTGLEDPEQVTLACPVAVGADWKSGKGAGVAKQLGKRFVHALGNKDAKELKAILRADVDFRAMTPRRFWETTDVDVVVDDTILGKWFEPPNQIIEILHIETDSVGPRHRVGYRLKVARPDGEYLVEQQAYFETDGDRISWLRIMCAGYQPAS